MTIFILILLLLIYTIIIIRFEMGFEPALILFLLVIAVIIGMPVFQIERHIYNLAEKIATPVKEIKIESLSNSDKHIYLIVKASKDFHYHYIIEGELGKEIKSIKSSNVSIVENNDNEEPKIILYKYKLKNKFLSFIISESLHKNTLYQVIIPEGSIKFVYDLKLQ